ncbi:hypothetical protein OF83DRAFT_1289452 [Amylostereum chailletii]|nr:hypothetical protein OF83DRAFT_1289452 [Amylostereum chailletii]
MALDTVDRGDHRLTSAQDCWTFALRSRLVLTEGIAPLSSHEIVDDARRTVDDDVGAIQHLLCTLKSRRNSFSPIASLPPEILAYVFEIRMEDPGPPLAVSYNSSAGRPPLEWIVVTQVCGHWRQVALSQPRLWTEIPFAFGHRWTKWFLERAKHAPISVRKGLSNSVGASTEAHLIPNHIHHTKELILTGLLPSIQNVLQESTSGAPYLECLQISPYPLSHGSTLPLPAHLFANNAPKLRRLVLRGFTIPWSSTLLNNLTLLEIDLGPGTSSASTPPSFLFSDIMGGLSRMHFLQKLVLKDCLPLWSAPHPESVIPLPHLSQIDLQGPARTSYEVLNRLRIPSRVRVKLTCSFAQDAPADLHRMHALLASHFPLQGIRAIRLNAHYGVAEVTAWDSWAHRSRREPHISFLPNGNPLLDLRFTIPTSTRSASDVVRDMVVELRVWGTVSFFPCLVRPIDLPDEPGVTEEVDGDEEEQEEEESLEDTGMTLFMPRLQSISIHDVDFGASFDDDAPELLELINRLPDWLGEREDHGLRLDELRIKACDIKRDCVEELEDVVLLVQWDYDQGEYNDEAEEQDHVYDDYLGVWDDWDIMCVDRTQPQSDDPLYLCVLFQASVITFDTTEDITPHVRGMLIGVTRRHL